MRIRFFPDKSAISLVEGITWLRNFVRMTIQNNLLELHGDPDTSWTVSGRGRDLNTAVVGEYVKRAEPPVASSGARMVLMNLAERGQKRLMTLANFDLHHGRLSPLA